MNKKLYKGLCYRCEHRALFHETYGTHQPRFECGDGGSKLACYMYSPVRPVVIEQAIKDDPRPWRLPNYFAGRAQIRRVAEVGEDIRLHVKGDESTDEALLYWAPELKEKEK